MTMKNDWLEKITVEIYNALAQMHLSVTEFYKVDMKGRRNIGLYRLHEAAEMLRRCADRLDEVKLPKKRKETK